MTGETANRGESGEEQEAHEFRERGTTSAFCHAAIMNEGWDRNPVMTTERGAGTTARFAEVREPPTVVVPGAVET